MTRQKLLRILAATALAAAAPCGMAAQPGDYAGLHLGVSNVDDWPASVDFGGGVSAPGRMQVDGRGHGGVFLGRQTGKARFELEYQYGRLRADSVQAGGVSSAASGRGHYELLTANAYRTAELSSRWTGYAGAGIGWGRVTLPAASLRACNCFPKADRGGFAWQLRLGAEYALDTSDLLFGQLTYMRLPRTASSGAVPSVSYDRRGVAALSVGYRRVF